jgi:hypothetical protein
LQYVQNASPKPCMQLTTRLEERQLSVAEQGYEGVSYVPTLQQGTPADDLGKAACLNRALRRLYPNDETPISGNW